MPPSIEQDPVRCATRIIDLAGPDLRMAVPVAIGKPNLLLNALYGLVEADRRLSLQLFTGLTLVRPTLRRGLERRFAGPIVERMFEGYPDLAYAEAARDQRLPANIRVHEFFLQAGAWLGNATAQQSFISMGYSAVAEHLLRTGLNVLAQLVAPDPAGGERVSLSSNPDISLDLKPTIDARKLKGARIAVAGEINAHLPYMPGPAEVARDGFDVLLEPPQPHFEPFSVPRQPVTLTDYALALHAATLIKDGGTLQIGIGSFADALTQALILRHTRNSEFRTILRTLGVPPAEGAELGPFETGLYGCSEMLVDGFLVLREAGILKRTVMGGGADGGRTPGPVLAHAGFFFGHRGLYQALRDLPPAERAQLRMSAISFTNTLRGDVETKKAQRTQARFINTGLACSLLGAVSSDQLPDGRVISGVGGQHDFVSMALELPDARSIIALRSTRRAGGKTSSNIVWQAANVTVPRHQRDVIVTEHGIADLRGRSDRDVALALLQIADSRFQPALHSAAVRGGKIERGLRLDEAWTRNTPERVAAALSPFRRSGLLPEFPFGSDMTPVEQRLAGPLSELKSAGPLELLQHVSAGLMAREPGAEAVEALERLSLARPLSLEERLLRLLILGALSR